MGLELTELILAIEDEFKFECDDKIWNRIRTVGDAYDYIVERAGSTTKRTCYRLADFLKIRRALAEISGRPTYQIKLDTSIDELLPMSGRRAVWTKVRDSSTLPIPTLKRPLHVVVLTTIMAVAVAAYVYPLIWRFLLSLHSERLAAWGIAFVIMFGTAFYIRGVEFVTLPFATRLPAKLRTPRRILEEVCPECSPQAIGAAIDNDRIWRTLHEVVCRTFNVKPEEVTRDTRFGDDLGL